MFKAHQVVIGESGDLMRNISLAETRRYEPLRYKQCETRRHLKTHFIN